MKNYYIAEVFGHSIYDNSDMARKDQKNKFCPFRRKKCNKSSKKDPLGVCSITDGEQMTSVCPARFLQDNRIFLDAAKIAFGEGVSFVPVPEIKILKKEDGNKVGKVDYLLAKLDENGVPCDFAALEIQSVYFSGGAIKPAMRYFLEHARLDPSDKVHRRPDFRSSAQKRLMPQLRLKVPVFRRWGKKFFVAVDSAFFEQLPAFKTVEKANSEIAWLSYPFEKSETGNVIGDPKVIFTTLDDILDALREGVPPTTNEILEELKIRVKKSGIIMNS